MPKKSKKGGAGKGGGKTEEERLLHLQQRAQAEEEMAQKKEEILTLFLKDKLQKEERNTAVNLLKLTEGWRSILRQSRADELRSDVAVLSQTFERHLDGLDGVIENLQRDLLEAERRSAQARRVHLQHVERLLALQDRRLALVQQRWEAGLQRLSSRFSSERTEMIAHSEQRRADLEDATFAVEQQHKAETDAIHRLYGESVESYESAYNDWKAALNGEDKEKLADLILQRQAEEQICSKETKELDELVCRNQDSIRRTNADMRRVKKLQDAVILLRAQLNSSRTENRSAEQDLTAARNHVSRETRKLRDHLTQAHAAARKQLTNLTVQSDNAAKKLKAVIVQGEKVLRVAEKCHKVEREQQSISSTLFPAEERGTGAEAEEPEKGASGFPELHQMTLRINAAVLKREALKRQRDDLSRENRQLRLLLRQHLDAMTVNDAAFDGRHALLAARRAPTSTAPLGADRRHTVIEGVHAVKQSL